MLSYVYKLALYSGMSLSGLRACIPYNQNHQCLLLRPR
uniref:Uncharacterized protein n=1 Tax=Arundo donax TaxID=35708 RepID=A0A0A9CBT6_ARUDO